MKEKKPTSLLQKIFEIRRAKKITLEKLGKILGGITPEAASRVENGDIPFKAEHIPAVAKLLNVFPWELFVDYKAGEIGPLNDDEKNIIIHFRSIKSLEKRQVFHAIAQQLAKK